MSAFRAATLLKQNPFMLLQAASLSLLCVLLYAPALPPLAHDWYTYEPFSYGALIPFIALYLIWLRNEELRNVSVLPNVWGIFSLLFVVSLAILGNAVEEPFTVRVAMILTLVSLTHLLLGKEFIKALWFPLAYLALMIPFPYGVVKEVAHYLRLIDAVAATPALSLLGVPVYRETYFLYLPGVTLEVADLCSGINSLFALFALGSMYVYLLPLRVGWKIGLALTTIPFAVAVNIVRIILFGALAHYIGAFVLGTLVHSSTGMITFFISLALFIGLAETVQRKVPSARAQGRAEPPMEHRSKSVAAGNLKGGAFVIAVAILVSGVVFSRNLASPTPVSLAQSLESLPVEIAPYQSSPERWAEPYHDPNAEQALSRMYLAPGSSPVELFVGYRSYQRENKRLLSPKLIFPHRWNFVSADPARIQISAATQVNANWLLTQTSNQRRLVLYWYQVGERTFGSDVSFRFGQTKRLLLEGHSNAALVRVATAVGENEALDKAKNRIAQFVMRVYPRLTEIVPG
jgi:EpsI family protein